MRAVLSIGSNMDDRFALLDTVTAHFEADPTTEIIAASRIYSTPPWGVTDQDEFLNQTLIVETTLEPLELLHAGQALENAAERVRIRRWGPRTLDVDIIALSGASGLITSSTEELTVPHPRAHERAFVLVPWAEIEPEATLGGTPITELIAGLPTDEVSQIVPAQRPATGTDTN
ncbi:2-amino-4-hydroxy-6-hydroxymethyldihydropteridinepyrophosphokinase [Corynebacterium renale]|uniref:2-amino-4-hydroxy-6-hydroxymethyldihydropteridine diphosphokinase n=1 Tax=Corynebacterium renale TaxID=1724 RepID=A0A2A9DPT1_9CORY|nr:2-amino-4-hydroxy-6-hydroxymethyldihydropteridine diphosphokinase [Corynebacterium renale]PFG27992.1 2-amino-4-hydroxy-6-hydroxymethyldihydropteridine diphosphokinase [Corynebacterium renale]SQG63285.1 2-amino-4-hydroxy-6-hydroxymethyldihydropteridinepyrophosphokinase [Corynebacterium renale]SQI21458.1 2-amino-4-hydroxy-6-hydroxymethyldihydropteridinepyrophosphokinase [Corynebacterium renale]STC99347.1 2-amino-4-hydroxy-6-hydroxymethyldihydropteridinepyrophosphokinase [Corynebacterium renale